MCEDAVEGEGEDEQINDEVRFMTDRGTVVVSHKPGRPHVWIGMSPGPNASDEPHISMPIGPELRKRLAAAILEIGTNVIEGGE